MKWTPENCEKLLRVWCQTHQNTINVAIIAANWPVDPEDDDMPTPKALKEHLAKYKKDMMPGASLNISFGTKETQGTDSLAPAPRKRKVPAGVKSAKKGKPSQELVEDGEE